MTPQMKLDRYKAKQQELLDNLPGEEGRNILVCEDCGEFVYLAPITEAGTCKGCGSFYSTEVRVKNL